MKAQDLDFNVFEKIGEEWALVSAGNEEKSNTMTISWGGVGVLWHKEVAFLFIRESRYTREFLDGSDTFSVAFFDEKYKKALEFCGSASGRDREDKWADAGLTPAYSDGVVYPKEANLVFKCKKMARVPIGAETFTVPGLEEEHYADHDMHVMYIGEIAEVVKC